MKKMVKVLSISVCLIMLMGSLFGCGQSNSQNSASSGSNTLSSTQASSTEASTVTPGTSKLSGSITFWMQKYGGDPNKQQEFMNNIAKDFKDKYGVTVNYSIIDWGQALTKYTLASTGGEAPDVADTFFASSQIKMGGDNYGPMIIDDVVNKIGFDKFYDFAKPECFFDGHWYALPWRASSSAAVYNEKDFKDAGITEFPKTFDDLIKVGKTLTKKDANGQITKSGYAFTVGNARFDQAWFTILPGFGSKLMNDDYTKFTFFDSQQAKESLQFMQDSIYKYGIIPKNALNPSYNSQQLYMAGKISILLGASSDMMNMIKEQAPQMVADTKSAIMPSKTGRGISSVSYSAPICVYKSTKNPDAAKAFLEYFVSKDVQLQAVKAFGFLDTRKDVMDDPYFTEDPFMKSFSDQIALSQPGDMPLATWSQVDAFPQGPLNNMCSKIVAGQDIQKAIDESKAAIEKILPGSTK